MFATFFLERDPLRTADLPAALTGWLQVAGGYAALGLVIWLLAYLLTRAGGGAGVNTAFRLFAFWATWTPQRAEVQVGAPQSRLVRVPFAIAAGLALFFYGVV